MPASLAEQLYAVWATERGPECKVCSARPNADGERIHGKGCYMLSEDGGGSDWPHIAPLAEQDEETRAAWERVAEVAITAVLDTPVDELTPDVADRIADHAMGTPVRVVEQPRFLRLADTPDAHRCRSCGAPCEQRQLGLKPQCERCARENVIDEIRECGHDVTSLLRERDEARVAARFAADMLREIPPAALTADKVRREDWPELFDDDDGNALYLETAVERVLVIVGGKP